MWQRFLNLIQIQDSGVTWLHGRTARPPEHPLFIKLCYLFSLCLCCFTSRLCINTLILYSHPFHFYCICTTNTHCSLSSFVSLSYNAHYCSRTHHISVCFSVYLHLCCHYLLAEAIICLEQGASSMLLCIRPHWVLTLNCCKPCYTANHYPAIPYCTLPMVLNYSFISCLYTP